MKKSFLGLSGPMLLKVGAGVVAIAAIVALFFAYDWIGTNMLDSGGTLG